MLSKIVSKHWYTVENCLSTHQSFQYVKSRTNDSPNLYGKWTVEQLTNICMTYEQIVCQKYVQSKKYGIINNLYYT